MKRYFILLILYCLFAGYSAIAAERWAIVVGIGNYPVDSGWSTISGDKDLELVVPMLCNLGFPRTHVKTLSNQEATKQHIQNAFDCLIPKLKKGDIVYFHFSGHGQLITDIDGDEGDYGYDESIVPYDAKLKYDVNGYKGENHIVDDELNKWLMAVREQIGRSGKIFVVLDACHSGGGSRDEGDESEYLTVRGTCDRFRIESASQTRCCGISPLPIDWVCVSACKSDQRNYEYKTENGKSYGRLSWVLSRFLTANLTVGELEDVVNRHYQNLPVTPYPQEAHIEYAEELANKSLL